MYRHYINKLIYLLQCTAYGADYCYTSSVSVQVCVSIGHQHEPRRTDEPIQMMFGIRTHVGTRNHVLDGTHVDATWRIRWNDPCAAAMRPYVKLL